MAWDDHSHTKTAATLFGSMVERRPQPPVMRLKLWLAWAEVVEYFGGTNLAALAIVGCPRVIYQGDVYFLVTVVVL